MPLDRRWIESHIPHQGPMCLLDEVLSWDDTATCCRSTTHRSPKNPLRAFGRLGVACGVEYAAQAMAIHGALMMSTSEVAAPRGFLASVRGVQLNIDRLDQLPGDLVASVRRLASDERTALYEFSIVAEKRLLLAGRATIAFNTP